MKKGKKLLSLILALAMLCGLVQIPVSAVGTERPEQLKLTGIMPITGDVLSGTNLSTNTAWYDKGMLIFFNQATSIQRLVVRGRIVVVDENNNVVTYNGTKLVWQTGNRYSWMPSGTNNLYGLYGHFLTLSSNVKINNKTYDTWTLIAKLLTETPELSGYKLQFRLTDNNSGINGYVDTVQVDNTTSSEYLVANLAVASGDVPTTGGNYDCASIDFGVAIPATDDRAAYVQPTSIVTLDRVTMNTNTDMTLTFSQAVTIDTARNTAVLEIVKANGEVQTTTYPVTLTAGNAQTVSASLATTQWTTVRTALANAGAGSYVRFKMTETNIEPTRGELYSNYAVDTVWSTAASTPLRANNTTASATTADYVLCPVTAEIPEVLSAVLQDADADTVQVLVTFNKPVTVNARNNDVWLRFSSFSNGAGQLQMTNKEYINGHSVEDHTYSNQILFSFANPNKPINGNVGILFAEYNYHSGSHEDYHLDGCVIADENGIGLLPTNITSPCNNNNCTAQRVSLSYTKATLAEQAQAITSVSRVDATHVSVKFPMNVTNIDITKAITLGNCSVTAVEGNADTWTFTLDRALTAADTVLTIPANAVTTGYNGTVVAKEMTATLPFADQVQAGGTVTLTEDLTVEELAVAEGVTLDLNGHVLTAQTIVSHGNVINSQSSGGIKIGKNVADDNKLMLHADNEQLALYDAEFGGYRFFSVTAGHLEKERADSVVFGIQLTASAQAMELLLHEDNADVTLQTVFTLTVDGEEREIPPYFYQAELLAEYLQTVQSGAAGNWAITLQVYGFEATAHNSIVLTAMPTLVSATGVTVTPGAAGVHTYTYTK